MSKLGDSFPRAERDEYVVRHLRPAQILHLFCEFVSPQKDKYLLLAHVADRPLLFAINSRIPVFVERSPDLRASQIKMSASLHDFLEHDSFINCAEVIRYFSLAEVREQLLNDVGRIKGELAAATTKRVIQAVGDAKTISARHKKLIIASLKQRCPLP